MLDAKDIINTYLIDMWVESSDDQTAPIYCQSCKKMIEENIYSAHWRTCNPELPPKILATKKILTPSSQSSSTKPQPQKEQKVEVMAEEATFNCPKCSQIIPIQVIQDHELVCQKMQVECSYCSTLVPADEIDQHEGSCDSNPNQNNGGIDFNQLISLMQMMNNNQNGNGENNGNRNGNNNALAGLLRNRNAMATLAANDGIGRNRQSDATEDLLQNSLFPALRNMDKGIKKRVLDQLPTEQYSIDIHKQSKCPICMEDFEEGEAVMKISCSHIFHDNCYKNWLRHSNTCPLCKTVIKISKPQAEINH